MTPAPGELSTIAPPGLTPLPAPTPVPARTAGLEVEPLAAFAAARLVSASAAAPFSVERGVFVVAVRGEVRVRLDGLLAARGEVALHGERKRFRGRATENAFGEGATRMHRASGEGALLFRAAGRRLHAARARRRRRLLPRGGGVRVRGARSRSRTGAVPSHAPAELNLVHLRGRGAVLVVTAGEPVALDVGPGAPLRVPLAALVGWPGSLTPRLGTLSEDGEGAPVAVELAGEGRVLVDPGVPAPGGAP